MAEQTHKSLYGGKFPEIILELNAAFVRVPVDQIDDEINAWLERICLTLDLDRSTIAEIDASTGWVVFTHGWAREPGVLLTRALDANALLPWTIGKMLAGETVVMLSPECLPTEAIADRQSFQQYGTKSNVMVPIKIGGVVIAAMSFAALRHARSWPPELVHNLETVAQMFGHAFSRRRAEIESTRLRIELMHLARVAALGELVAGLTHELTQPISAIGINAETALALLESPHPAIDNVKEIIRSIVEDNDRSAGIVQRLRPLFRREPTVKSELDVAAVLDDVAKILKMDAQIRKIQFTIDIRQPLPIVLGDRIQLQQAIINLVLNGFDAVAAAKPWLGHVNLAAESGPNGHVKLVVGDTGEGMNPRLLDKIFEPFITTKINGMGMGLPITRSIIQAHGGRISVDSRPSKGTEITIDLPGGSG